MIPQLFLKRNFLLVLFSLLTLIGIFVYVVFDEIDRHNTEVKEQYDHLLFQEAMSLFETMTKAREWNANYAGVYVKKQKGMKPNPYLKNNTLRIDDNNTLIRINPAWMTRQIGELINENSDRYFHMTSLRPLNPNNSPDEFEKEALHYFENNPEEKYFFKKELREFSKDKVSKQKIDQKSMMYNFVGRLDTKLSCLECHAVQGYKLGDLRGGIRISLPADKYKKAIESEYQIHELNKYILVILLIILLSLIYAVLYLFSREQRRLEEFNQVLENKVYERTKELNEINSNLETKIADEVTKSKEKDKLIITQSRQAAMGEMISMIAHQWRQPISTIAMDASNMMIDIQLKNIDKDEFQEYAQAIIDQTDHLSNTIDDFRNFFHQDKDKSTFLPSKVANDCFKMVGAALDSHGIKYEVLCISEKMLSTYPRELMQVILNLINNAKDVLIECKTKDPHIVIKLDSNDYIATIKVCDNGVGISDDVLPHIFEPYFTTKDKKNGTGLGLYMSKMIVEEQLNGRLLVNTEEKETCFTIELTC